jgi:anti-sigma factor RsiW
MSCENTTELLMDRLKGQISAADEQRLAAHLATCDACKTEAAMMTSAWDQLGELDEEVPHERLRARFHAGLAAYEARESRHWRSASSAFSGRSNPCCSLVSRPRWR